MTKFDETADVIVVGAGPAGSAAAYHAAREGLSVLCLEKTAFPREKVCGDGLTPRAVKALHDMGIPLRQEDGWIRNKGLRLLTSRHRIHVPWPELNNWPGYGLVRTREDYDDILARHAQAAGVKLYESTTVTGPIWDDNQTRILGVTGHHQDGTPQRFGAPVIIAADGNSSRLALAAGLSPRRDRPMGVAVRTYYRSERHADDWLESHLELRGENGEQLPGYGWIFGVGDGTSNIGLGLLNTSKAFGRIDSRALLKHWVAGLPPEWNITEEHRTRPMRGAALPMAFNRTPHYTKGLLLAGDAGGMVNPFNGEGIAYAMEAGQMAASTAVQALRAPSAASREAMLREYPLALANRYGGYYSLGRAFVKLIANERILSLGLRMTLSRTTLARITMKLLANLTDPTGGDTTDKVINTLCRVMPR